MATPQVSSKDALSSSDDSFVKVQIKPNDLGDPAFPRSSSPINRNLSTLETASPFSRPTSSPPLTPPLSPVQPLFVPSFPLISQKSIDPIPPLSPFWQFISFINLPRHFIHFCRLIWTGEFRYSLRNLWNKLFNSIYQTKLINLLNQHFEFWKRQLSKQPNFPVEIQIRLHCGAGFYKVKIAAIRNKKSWDQVLSKDLPNIQRRIELHIGKTNIRDANLEASFFLIFSSENKLRKMSGKEIIALSPAQQVLLEIEQQEQQSCYNTSSLTNTSSSPEKTVVCQCLTTTKQPEELYSRVEK